MSKVDDFFRTLHIPKMGPVAAFFWCAIITVAIGVTDYLTGYEISISIFYLIPITLAVFLSGMPMGLVFSLICAASWILADNMAGLRNSSIFVPIWNMSVRLCYFVFHTFLLSSLVRTIRIVKDSALHDPLTKAANWRFFEEFSNATIKTALREQKGIAIVYIDVDNFKRVNDTFGHGIGDLVLITVAESIASEIRPQDLLARLGGDEFAVMLYNADGDATRRILARITDRVRDEMRARDWNVTLSVGAKVFPVPSATVGPMLKTVDDIMYEVKKGGKDSVRLEI